MKDPDAFPNPPILPLLINIYQVSALLGGICDRQIRRWRSSSFNGFPQPVGLGKLARWRRTDIEAWVAKLPAAR